jgi:drug/metabolite transporter superfamily protein YnfA
MTSDGKTWISRIALVILIVALLFRPWCYCPGYYVGLSLIGLIPLLCGPRLYRWFGGVYILTALLFATFEHRAELRQAEKIQRMRTELHTQTP